MQDLPEKPLQSSKSPNTKCHSKPGLGRRAWSPEGWCHTPKVSFELSSKCAPPSWLWPLCVSQALVLINTQTSTAFKLWLKGWMAKWKEKVIFPESYLSYWLPLRIIFKMMPLVHLDCHNTTPASKSGLENMLYVQSWARSSAAQLRWYRDLFLGWQAAHKGRASRIKFSLWGFCIGGLSSMHSIRFFKPLADDSRIAWNNMEVNFLFGIWFGKGKTID